MAQKNDGRSLEMSSLTKNDILRSHSKEADILNVGEFHSGSEDLSDSR